MFPIEGMRRWSVRLLGAAGVPLTVALAIAGCGGSSSAQSGGQANAAHSTAGPAHAELTVESSHYGPAIFGANHRVVYQFASDHTTKSTCYGKCAKAWPPVLTEDTPKVGSGLDSSLLGTTTRRDGSEQVTYAGHPLYYFEDDKPGTIMCQHVKLHGGFWYVVKASGRANLAKGKAMMK
jgi:predicted lipoprotein with Yx(FWY)xxD motif